MHSLKHPIRFVSIFALVLSAVFIGNAGTAAAANPLLCFDGPSDETIYGGDCTINPGGTSATLNTADGDPDGSYAGVYVTNGNTAAAVTIEASVPYTPLLGGFPFGLSGRTLHASSEAAVTGT